MANKNVMRSRKIKVLIAIRLGIWPSQGYSQSDKGFLEKIADSIPLSKVSVFTVPLHQNIIYKIRILLIGLASFLTLSLVSFAYARNPLILTDAQGKYPLGLHLEILEDQNTTWTIDDVTSPEIVRQFVPSQVKVPNFGFTSSAYWVRFRVRNEASPTIQWRLEMGFPNMQQITLYLPKPEQPGFEIKKTGNLFPFDTRDVAHHHFIFKLPLPLETEQTIYLRLCTNIGKFPTTCARSFRTSRRIGRNFSFYGTNYWSM